MEQGTRDILAVAQERAILVACLLPGNTNDPHNPLGELESLAQTAGAIVVDHLLQNKYKPIAKTFIGKGKVEELAEMVRFHEANVILFDNDLSPSQISNIEEMTECKVLDRSELILDIFAARARTYEAKLQVELAQLQYTYPRLRAMWSHLERIVGGNPAGIGTRGPGEQQLEVDRRIVQKRKSDLKAQIKQVQSRKTREVEKRNKDFFTVGIVGYTNAGKSTLFNTATEKPKGGGGTGGGAYADDKLFATLSTRTRRWDLGDGDAAMLSDTVGFVRDLPHHLVASFEATLAEAVHSNLLLIVLDVADPRAQHQLQTVLKVLDDIGANHQPRLLLLNKTDQLEHNGDLLVFTQSHENAIPISAKTGQGIDQLIATVRDGVRGGLELKKLDLPASSGKAIHFLESRSTVIQRDYIDDRVHMTVRIGSRPLAQLRSIDGDWREI